jgi:hypothetical protein
MLQEAFANRHKAGETECAYPARDLPGLFAAGHESSLQSLIVDLKRLGLVP